MSKIVVRLTSRVTHVPTSSPSFVSSPPRSASSEHQSPRFGLSSFEFHFSFLSHFPRSLNSYLNHQKPTKIIQNGQSRYVCIFIYCGRSLSPYSRDSKLCGGVARDNMSTIQTTLGQINLDGSYLTSFHLA
jgi:hypothetical protein